MSSEYSKFSKQHTNISNEELRDACSAILNPERKILIGQDELWPLDLTPSQMMDIVYALEDIPEEVTPEISAILNWLIKANEDGLWVYNLSPIERSHLAYVLMGEKQLQDSLTKLGDKASSMIANTASVLKDLFTKRLTFVKWWDSPRIEEQPAIAA